MIIHNIYWNILNSQTNQTLQSSKLFYVSSHFLSKNDRITQLHIIQSSYNQLWNNNFCFTRNFFSLIIDKNIVPYGTIKNYRFTIIHRYWHWYIKNYYISIYLSDINNMKLYLFWWAEEWQAAHECKMIEAVIKSIAPTQLLHVPFARVREASRPERKGDRFHRHIDLGSIQYLNANNPDDLAKANNPVIFISGGNEHINLINSITQNPKILEFIQKAEHIIGESAWSKVLWSYYNSRDDQNNNILLPSLNIIQNTIIEGHYTQRNKAPAMDRAVKKSKAKYSIGIDSCTAVIFNLDQFPSKYETIGDGDVFIQRII